jgi:LPS-assembly protein
VIRRFVFACALLAASFARAQAPTTLEADQSVGDWSAGEGKLTGHVHLIDEAVDLTCDEMMYNGKTDVASATGHIVVTFKQRGGARLLADHLVYNRRQRTFTAESVRLGNYPYFIEAFSASGTPDEITLKRAQVSYGEPGPWEPMLSSDTLVVVPGHEVRSENSMLGIGHVQPFPLPKLRQQFSAPFAAAATLSGGVRHSLGVYVDAGIRVPVTPILRLGGDVGLYTSRGVLVGPGARYASPDDADALSGIFRSGYIHDYGNRGTDLLGQPVPADRGFVEWQHRQTLTDNLTLSAQLNWWKDSEVLRDFRPREFFPVQQPDNFVDAVYTGQNYFVSAFTRFQPNRFQRVQQRLPEIQFDLLPTAIGGGFVERFNASAAILREDPLRGDSSPKFSTDRLDAYYAIERPWAPTEWFAFTPIAGGRLTYYHDAKAWGPAPASGPPSAPALIGTQSRSLGNYTRGLGEIGFDAALRASGTFAYSNPAWQIDGLRHLVTPRISYRYIPEGDQGRAHIPPIDREVFSTYLQPLGLGDVRHIDDLHATNTLRLGVDNVLQTRDAKNGTRDLASLALATDVQFKRRPWERDWSKVHGDFSLMPARWLQFDVYGSVVPQTFTLREFNSAITLHDGNAWSVRFTNNYLRPQPEDSVVAPGAPADPFQPRLNEYFVDGRFRINEVYQAIARLDYDARRRRFNEQAYGIVQNLGNTWLVSYTVSLYEGRRRESRFGFNIQIDTVRF